MEQRIMVDMHDYPRLNPGRDAPVWWGMLGLILILITVSGAFIATYFYLQMSNDPWPMSDGQAPDLWLPTINLVLLLLSCVTMRRAGRAVQKNQNPRLVTAILASCGLAALVLVLRFVQFTRFEFGWSDHVYGSIVWTISGFHFLLVLTALMSTAVIGWFALKHFFTPVRRIGLVVVKMFWYFAALSWIPFYLVLYWVPRWL